MLWDLRASIKRFSAAASTTFSSASSGNKKASAIQRAPDHVFWSESGVRSRPGAALVHIALRGSKWPQPRSVARCFGTRAVRSARGRLQSILYRAAIGSSGWKGDIRTKSALERRCPSVAYVAFYGKSGQINHFIEIRHPWADLRAHALPFVCEVRPEESGPMPCRGQSATFLKWDRPANL